MGTLDLVSSDVEGLSVMAVSEKDFRDLAREVSELKATISTSAKVVGAISSVAVLVGGAALSWCFRINSKVDVIESGGNTKLVTQLRGPSSPQQLSANLATVVAQVQTAQALGKKPSPAKVKELSSAVASVIRQRPDTPEVWPAASELVSLRSNAQVSGTEKNCFESRADMGPGTPPMSSEQPVAYSMGFGYCHIDLGDIEGFKRWFAAGPTAKKPHGPVEEVNMYLDHVRIEYNGGPMLPITNLYAVDCSLDFNIPSAPPQHAQDLVAALLEANDLGKTFKIEVPATG